MKYLLNPLPALSPRARVKEEDTLPEGVRIKEEDSLR
jgi:hypothetical protein